MNDQLTSRRELLLYVLPACSLCLGFSRLGVAAAQKAQPLPLAKRATEKMEISYEDYFKFSYGEMIPVLKNLSDQIGKEKFIEMLKKAFTITAGNWRGIGRLPESALQLKEELKEFDAREKFDVHIKEGKDINFGCECHLVIIGKIKPKECPMFMKACTPTKPVGACMVSSEGTCSVWAKNVAAQT